MRELTLLIQKWRSVARTGMAQVFDWRSSARQYIALYKEIIKRP